MKNLYLIFIFLIFLSCSKEEIKNEVDQSLILKFSNNRTGVSDFESAELNDFVEIKAKVISYDPLKPSSPDLIEVRGTNMQTKEETYGYLLKEEPALATLTTPFETGYFWDGVFTTVP